MSTQKHLGRPTEIPDRVDLVVYLTRQERAAIIRAAQRAGVSVSAWCRACLRAGAASDAAGAAAARGRRPSGGVRPAAGGGARRGG